MKKIFELLVFGKKIQGEIPKSTYHTIQPSMIPSFSDWCNENRVSSNYKNNEPIIRAKTMMNQWGDHKGVNWKKTILNIKIN